MPSFVSLPLEAPDPFISGSKELTQQSASFRRVCLDGSPQVATQGRYVCVCVYIYIYMYMYMYAKAEVWNPNKGGSKTKTLGTVGNISRGDGLTHFARYWKRCMGMLHLIGSLATTCVSNGKSYI